MATDPLSKAIGALQSDNDNERLAAAREVLKHEANVSADVAQKVREALAREAVPWVRGALAEIVTVADGVVWDEGVEVPAPSWDADLAGLEPDAARTVINMSTKRVLHEVAAVVGRAKLAASGDLREAYGDSETARQLEFLSDVCSGLRTLSAATQVPEPIEFDLAGELGQLATEITNERLWPIHVNGPAPFIVTSDRALLRVAVTNILVNAIEATVTVGPADESRAVVLTWGMSPGGLHTTVIDRGPGPPTFLAAIRSAGVSTKTGHPGYGLATASEAMKSLGGTVRIRRNDRGGATVVLSWKESA
jgi:signal transduction histidine kinase